MDTGAGDGAADEDGGKEAAWACACEPTLPRDRLPPRRSMGVQTCVGRVERMGWDEMTV